MIELRNVTKTYALNKKTECTAISDVSLVLPDKGFVFIIGKSGSGKSTLLNLIGGLDTPTNGTIISDGNEITKYNQRMLTKYRSSYIGFIFQDYHVLDSFTVRQNINLALDIASIKDDEKVDEILKVVDLTEYVDRYPTELSGGQKQRIAVARALVKDAKVILCDEPTGNLDANTSKQILDLLKEISQEKLVVIVSHNMVEANNYADRIIELYDGIIVRDRRRSANYSNEFKIEDNVIYIPHYRDLTLEEEEIINNTIIENDNVSFKQIGNKFLETHITAVDKEPYVIKSRLISRKTSKKLFKSFFKGKWPSISLSVFLAAVLLTCFAIFQSFLSFDANAELSKSLTKHDIYSVPLQKGVETNDGFGLSKVQVVYDDEINKFYENGFSGNIYKKYTYILPITTYSTTISKKGSYSPNLNIANFYLKETFGVINCNEEYLASLYGINNESGEKELKILKASEVKDYGIYITDYVADSILLYQYKTYSSYENLLGEYLYSKTKYGYINGIVETGYKEKYKNLVDSFNDILKNPESNIDSNKIKNSEEFSKFVVEAINFLGYGYSFNENFMESLKTTEFKTFCRIGPYYVTSCGNHIADTTIAFYNSNSLGENEIKLSTTAVQYFFPSLTEEEFEPFDMTFEIYEDFGNEKILYEKTFRVIGINSTYTYINLNANLDLFDYDIVPYGIYLDSHENISDVLLTATEEGYVVCSGDATKLSTINHVLRVFGKFFLFIEILFLVVCVIFIVNIGLSSVKKNKYEIGLLKAIGTSSFDIMRIYIRQTIIVCLLICIVTNIGIAIGTYVGNEILVGAFESILGTTFYELRLINYIPSIVFIDLLWIIVICLISFIIPQILLFRIKPIDIIRAKE